MDIRLRNLRRRAEMGNPEALEEYRVLALKIGILPEKIVAALVKAGYQPAREILPDERMEKYERYPVFDLLSFYDHGAALCIAHRVVCPTASDVLNHFCLGIIADHCWQPMIEVGLIDSKEDLEAALEKALQLLERMTNCEYLMQLLDSTRQNYVEAFTYYTGHIADDEPLVQHREMRKLLNALANCAQQTPLLFGWGRPKCINFAGAVHVVSTIILPAGNLNSFYFHDNLRGMRKVLEYRHDQVGSHPPTWIEAIFSYFLL